MVIPAKNEARNLEIVLPQLPQVHEVILVDGNSVDDTVAVARRLRPDVCILTQSGRGKGRAMAEGFNACTGEIIVALDADTLFQQYFRTGMTRRTLGYSNLKLDEILEAQQLTFDVKKREKLLWDAHKIILEDAPAVPLWLNEGGRVRSAPATATSVHENHR